MHALAFSPDGKLLASGSGVGIDPEPGELALWDPGTGELLATLDGHAGLVNEVSFSPDGESLASTGGQDHTARIWDLETRRGRRILRHKDCVTAVAYSPDGRTLATGCFDGYARLWDAAMGRLLKALPQQEARGPRHYVKSLSFSPDARTLAVNDRSGFVRLWEAETGRLRKVIKDPDHLFDNAVFSPDGRRLAVSVPFARCARVYDVASGQVALTLPHKEEVGEVAFSPDGALLAMVINTPYHARRSPKKRGWVQLWDLATGRRRASVRVHTPYAYSVAFSPDGKTLASGCTRGIELWSVDELLSRPMDQG